MTGDRNQRLSKTSGGISVGERGPHSLPGTRSEGGLICISGAPPHHLPQWHRHGAASASPGALDALPRHSELQVKLTGGVWEKKRKHFTSGPLAARKVPCLTVRNSSSPAHTRFTSKSETLGLGPALCFNKSTR